MKFKNLTPIPGFDSTDSCNSNQNNYAWSMAEFGDYIYVGTGRNIVSDAFKIVDDFGVKPPPVLCPCEKVILPKFGGITKTLLPIGNVFLKLMST